MNHYYLFSYSFNTLPAISLPVSRGETGGGPILIPLIWATEKLDAGYPESIKDMFDVIVDMSNVGRTFTPDIFVHQCCQRSLHIFSVMRCIKDSWIKGMFDVIVDMSMCRENFYTQTH